MVLKSNKGKMGLIKNIIEAESDEDRAKLIAKARKQDLRECVAVMLNHLKNRDSFIDALNLWDEFLDCEDTGAINIDNVKEKVNAFKCPECEKCNCCTAEESK